MASKHILGRIKEITGDVHIRDQNGKMRTPVVNSVVFDGEVVVTGKNARVRFLSEDMRPLELCDGDVALINHAVAGRHKPVATESAYTFTQTYPRLARFRRRRVEELPVEHTAAGPATPKPDELAIEDTAAGPGTLSDGSATGFLRLMSVVETISPNSILFNTLQPNTLVNLPTPLTTGAAVTTLAFLGTTDAPTTISPSTPPPVTEAPTTAPPVTEAPTTAPPVTEAPTTAPPVTEAPTTAPPTTEAPTTAPPVTEAPTTAPPVTEAPTTAPPTTEAPTTCPPTTETPEPPPVPTDAPTTCPPTTCPPTTETPEPPPVPTDAPTTHPVTTCPPTTEAPTTCPPTTATPEPPPVPTEAPTTLPPTTCPPTTEAPTTCPPTTATPEPPPVPTEAPTSCPPTTCPPTTEAPVPPAPTEAPPPVPAETPTTCPPTAETSVPPVPSGATGINCDPAVPSVPLMAALYAAASVEAETASAATAVPTTAPPESLPEPGKSADITSEVAFHGQVIGIEAGVTDREYTGYVNKPVDGAYGRLTMDEHGYYTYTLKGDGNQTQHTLTDVFTYTSVDSNGVKHRDTFTVTILPDPKETTHNVILGTSGNDVLQTDHDGFNLFIGGAGDDTMYSSGNHSNTFKWFSSDIEGTTNTEQDTIIGFKVPPMSDGIKLHLTDVSGVGDRLDLRDLLPDIARMSGQKGELIDFIFFEKKGNDTLMHVEVNGHVLHSADSLQVVFKNVDFSHDGQYGNQDIIQALINRGNLIID